MARFARVYLNILDLHPIVAMHTLLVGLHLDKFLDTLYVDPPANTDDFAPNNMIHQHTEKLGCKRKGNESSYSCSTFLYLRSESHTNYTL